MHISLYGLSRRVHTAEEKVSELEDVGGRKKVQTKAQKEKGWRLEGETNEENPIDLWDKIKPSNTCKFSPKRRKCRKVT